MSWFYLNGRGGEGSLISIWHGFRGRNVFVAGPKYYGNLDWVSLQGRSCHMLQQKPWGLARKGVKEFQGR